MRDLFVVIPRRLAMSCGATALVLAAVLAFAAPSPAQADPPRPRYVGLLAYADGTVPARIACDTLDQARAVYEAGRDNPFLMLPKARELGRAVNAAGEPVCMVDVWGPAEVLVSELLGPVPNLVGDVELTMWAVNVRGLARGKVFWILYLDTQRPPSSRPTDTHLSRAPPP